MKYFILPILLILTTTSFAQYDLKLSDDQVMDMMKNKKKVKNKKSFDENREDKMFTASAGLGFSTRALAPSLRFGYFLTNNNILGLKVLAPNDKDGVDYQDEYKAFQIELSVKNYVSNTFYFDIGAFYRTQEDIEYGYSFVGNNFKKNIKTYHQMKDIGASFNIGNQWQWKYFTFGCDWAGFQYSVATLSGDKFDVNHFNLEDKLSINFLNLYVGASF